MVNLKKNTLKKYGKKSKSTMKFAKKMLIDKEFYNLKSILPGVNNKVNVDQTLILLETVKYIDSLENQVLAKLAEQKKSALTIQNKMMQIKLQNKELNNKKINFHNN